MSMCKNKARGFHLRVDKVKLVKLLEPFVFLIKVNIKSAPTYIFEDPNCANFNVGVSPRSVKLCV